MINYDIDGLGIWVLVIKILIIENTKLKKEKKSLHF